MSRRNKDKNINIINNTAKEPSSDILTGTVASAVVSDQITLFDETKQEETVITAKSTSEAKINNLKNVVNDNQIKLDLENLEQKPGNKEEPVNLEKTEEEKEPKKFNFLNLNNPPKTMLEVASSPEEDSQKLEEAEEAVKKQSSKKKKWLSFSFLVLNIAIVAALLLYNLLGDTEMTSFSDLLSSEINWGILALLVVVNLLITFTESARVWLLTWKTTGKSRPALGFKVSSYGLYYDCITPLSAGGEPFQVFYLNKHGVPAGEAISIPMGKYYIHQICYIFICIVVMLYSIFMPASNSNVGTTIVSVGAWLGLSFNFLLVVVIAILSISEKVGQKLIGGTLKLLKKMRIVKDYEKQYNKVMGVVNNYQKTMKAYTKNPSTFIAMIILSVGGIVLRYTTPYLIYATFNGFSTELYGELFVKTVMIDLTTSFIPIPGGSGVAELSFSALFASLMGPNIFWGMLIWRMCTYYCHIITGLFLTVYDYAIGNKKYNWLKQKWKLEEESRNFEEEQLRDFELTLNKQNKKRKKEIKK